VWWTCNQAKLTTPLVESRQFAATTPAFNLHHLHLAPLLAVTLFEFCRKFWQQKTRVPGLSRCTVCVILHLAVSVEHRLATDGQTDIQRQLIPALASDAWVKMIRSNEQFRDWWEEGHLAIKIWNKLSSVSRTLCVCLALKDWKDDDVNHWRQHNLTFGRCLGPGWWHSSAAVTQWSPYISSVRERTASQSLTAAALTPAWPRPPPAACNQPRVPLAYTQMPLSLQTTPWVKKRVPP